MNTFSLTKVYKYGLPFSRADETTLLNYTSWELTSIIDNLKYYNSLRDGDVEAAKNYIQQLEEKSPKIHNQTLNVTEIEELYADLQKYIIGTQQSFKSMVRVLISVLL